MAGGALVLLLVLAAAAEDYSGGALPQYEETEYERAPDAPPALDYKYEEDDRAIGVSEQPKEYDTESNRHPNPSNRRHVEPENDEEELVINAGEHRHGGRRRGRGRRHQARRELPARNRPRGKYKHRLRHDSEDYTSPEYRDESSELPDFGDQALINRRRAGRKPRDRIFVPPPPRPSSEGIIKSEVEETAFRSRPNKGFSGSDRDDSEYWSEEERVLAGRRPTQPPVDRPDRRPIEPLPGSRRLQRPNSYQNYNDYYDAKHFEDIKNRIPNLLRRTTTAEQTGLTQRALSVDTPLENFRRVGALLPDLTVGTPTTVTISSRAITTVAEPSSTTFRATVSPIASTSIANDTQISIAEQSRLSILKKIEQKERSKEGTKKPPVLLQVTKFTPTVVMVESEDGPFMRAREVVADSPETLDKVKRLMRQKLVFKAKSIRDLTDNWDETICDFIDVSLLDEVDNSGSVLKPDLVQKAPAACRWQSKYYTLSSVDSEQLTPHHLLAFYLVPQRPWRDPNQPFQVP